MNDDNVGKCGHRKCAGGILCYEKGRPMSAYTKSIDYKQIIAAMAEMQDDSDNDKLERAAEYYCSMWDKREGLKHALELTLRDQYENHAGEQADDDLVELIKILDLN